MWFNIFLSCIKHFHSFIPHSAFKLKGLCPTHLSLPFSCQGHLFSNPSFISQALRFSRSLFTSSLAWLPILLSVCSWCRLPFIRCPLFSLFGYVACYSSPVPAATLFHKVCTVTALTLRCLGRPNSHMAPGSSCTREAHIHVFLHGLFLPYSQPQGSAQTPGASGTGG